MKYNFLLFFVFIITSCVQNYPSEYKVYVDNLCECMDYRRYLRRDNIPDEAIYIYDDIDYKECLIDAIIDEIDPKSKEFTAAVEDLCPELNDVQDRYKNDLEL